MKSLFCGKNANRIFPSLVGRATGSSLIPPIAFNLLDEKITTYDLQKIHETILGKKLIKSNFRRYFKNDYIDTGSYILNACIQNGYICIKYKGYIERENMVAEKEE